MSAPKIITDEEQIGHVERVFADGAAITAVSISMRGEGRITFFQAGVKVEWPCGAAAVMRARDLMDEQSSEHLSKAFGRP
jgi:hypothetical protein